MKARGARARVALAAACLTLLGAAPALADDTEIFLSQGAAEGVRPNVLVILDTSGSMNGQVEPGKPPYDPTTTYPGACATGRVYWRRGAGAPPACPTPNAVADNANACEAARRAVEGAAGLWTGRAAQWHPALRQWRGLSAGIDREPVECAADAGVHGADASSSRRWARNGEEGSPWTSDRTRQIGWSSAAVYTLYGANWLNWYHAPPDPAARVTRLQTLQSVATTLAHSIDGVNLGLMRFSNNDPDRGDDQAAEGGMVIHAVENIATARDSIATAIRALEADGYSPLSETLYEAGKYLAGRNVDYGDRSRLDPDRELRSVPESRQPDDARRYRSPIEHQCQRSYVILLTDGEPREDNSADDRIGALPGFGSLVGQCDGDGPGRCLDELAGYLYEGDLSDLPGQQKAVTYTVGFGPEAAGAPFLEQTARAGGGAAFAAADVTELTSALQQIIGSILQSSSTFAAPAVAVDAFNRAQSANDLYVSVFAPKETLRWPGNLKKYALRDGRIVDSRGRDAIDPATGFFGRGTQSFWSAVPDEGQVAVGGAVSRLPAAAQRRLFTYLESGGNRALHASVNAFAVENAALTGALLGTGAGDPAREELIGWARGIDVQDRDADGDSTEQVRFMGDPLHARPAVVSYGGSAGSPDAADAVVFVPTNDGFLHAVDARTGQELWAFIPPELLDRLPELYRDPPAASRTYGLDGDVRVLRFDANQDGVIDGGGGDRIWIYFGMRRGGRFYYALDVTDRSRPELLWKLGPGELPGVGESWSMPSIARVRVAGVAQNGEHFVLVFGGGYDDAQESYVYTTDTSGHRIFMVDAASGNLLWYAGGPGGAGSPDLPLPAMTHSIPSRVSVLDTNGDEFADRMYAADTGGRLWRFDLWNGRGRASLVTGGVLASLGAAAESPPAVQSTRRFYYAADVALIQRRGADPYYNLAIGSGYRGHPLHTGTQDRFYSVRDANPFARLTQAEYDGLPPVTEADLVDITGDIAGAAVPTEARGWKLELRLNGGWVGEKVLAEALTVDGVILFPTYQPQAPDAANPCVPASGINRLYALGVDSGRPVVDFNDDQELTAADAWTQLAQTGIAGEVGILFESDGGSDEEEGASGRDALGRRALCLVGVEVLEQCVLPGSVVRTFWQRTATD